MVVVLRMSSQCPIGKFYPALQPGLHMVAFAPEWCRVCTFRRMQYFMEKTYAPSAINRDLGIRTHHAPYILWRVFADCPIQYTRYGLKFHSVATIKDSKLSALASKRRDSN